MYTVKLAADAYDSRAESPHKNKSAVIRFKRLWQY